MDFKITQSLSDGAVFHRLCKTYLNLNILATIDVTIKPSKLLFVIVAKAREWEIPNYLIPSVFISRFNVIVTKRDKSMFCK